MKHVKYFIGAVSCLVMLTASAFAQDMTAEDILTKVDEALDTSNTEMNIEMKVFRKKKLRKTYKMIIKARGWKNMIAETLFPPRNEGEKVLRVDADNMWMYFPKINKTMRVSESGSFSNSDFSNMDILNSQLSIDYTPELLGVEDYKGEETYKLELTAKTEDIPYAKIHYWIRKDDLYPLQRDYYTFSGHLLKRLVMQTKDADVRDGLPDVFLMTSVLEKDKYTVLRYTKFERGQTFPPEMFRKDSLMKR